MKTFYTYRKAFAVALCLLGTALTASAQFKIHSNGKMSFMRTDTALPISPISLEDGGKAESDSNYFVSYKGKKNGIIVKVENEMPSVSGICYGGFFQCDNDAGATSVGLRGKGYSNYLASGANPLGAVGVWGDCSSYWTQRYSYGVFGKVEAIDNYAAVCGMCHTANGADAIPDDQYAGLFVGKTKIVGDLTVTGTVYGVTVTPSGRGTADMRSISGESLSDKVQGLSTLSFRYPQKVRADSQRPSFLEPDEEKIEELKSHGIDPEKFYEPKEDTLSLQVQAKQHYALSADELEEVFPDLVYTDKNGEKSVNYVEMVPLLVQCINELNTRLSALEGDGAGPVPARDDLAAARASQNNVSAIDSTPSKTSAVLYQNTPNPFTAQTEIRFSLPDDAPQAYIYIFDMTGKMQKQIPVNPDQHSVTINGYELQAGIYLYSLVVGGQEVDTKRMILSK